MKFRHVTAAMVAAVALVGASSAGATIYETLLGVGVSKDNQANPPGDLSSKFGASLAGSLLRIDTTTGIFTAEIENVGQGIMTSFSLALNEDRVTLPPSGFTFTPLSCVVCNFEETNPGNVDGFGGHFDIGASATNPPPANGLANGESARFTWNVGPVNEADSDGSGTIDFFDFIDAQLVSNDQQTCGPDGTAQCSDFRAFWVAHIQGLAGGASDHIGGSRGNQGIVPEPGMVSLLGLGLASMGLLVGLRRKQR